MLYGRKHCEHPILGNGYGMAVDLVYEYTSKGAFHHYQSIPALAMSTVFRLSTVEQSGMLCEEAMLRPATEFLGRGAELHRIRGVRALHHDALEEIAAEHSVRITKPLVESERVGV